MSDSDDICGFCGKDGAENVLAHGTGAINVDACRVGIADGDGWDVPQPDMGVINPARSGAANGTPTSGRIDCGRSTPRDGGRWPANLIHDGSEEAVAGFPETSPSKSGGMSYNVTTQHLGGKEPKDRTGHDDAGGSAARFFYCAKPDTAERGKFNTHPTVKPVALMRYLIRLVTPPGGTVLDPFLGSGTTGVAADEEWVQWLGIERDAASVEIARRRTAEKQGGLFA